MEKLKNFIYDAGDVLLSILIVFVIVITLFVKLNSSIPAMDLMANSNDEKESDTGKVATVTIDMKGKNDSEVNVGNLENLKKPERDEVKNKDESSGEEKPDAQKTPEVEKKPEPKPNNTGEIKITIPSGYTSQKIADLLFEKKIISSTKDFLSVVESEGVSTRLQSGNFNLSSSMSYKEVARKIAGM